MSSSEVPIAPLLSNEAVIVSGASDAPSIAQLLRRTFREYPVTSVGGSWALMLGGTVGFIWTRRIPLQLKIIQGRIVAQAALLGGCILGGISAALFEPPRDRRARDAELLSKFGGGVDAGAFQFQRPDKTVGPRAAAAELK